MPTQVQLRRGTTAQTAVFTGASGEVTVNTDTNYLVVHDGTTSGGHPTATLAFAQAAFDVANSAFGGETSAGVQANAAFAQANAAFNKANTINLSSLSNSGYYANLNSDGTVTLPTAGVSGVNSRIQSPTGNVQINAGGAIFTFSNNNTLIYPDGSVQTVAYPTGTNETAHAAFDKANTAYSAAANAYTYTTSVDGYSQSGYATANSASTYANGAFIQANSSFVVANSSSIYANGAFIQANAAYAAANAAWASANNVAPQVQPAFSTANSASMYANGAFIQANAAFAVANAAMTAAMDNTYDQIIFDKANGAFTVANGSFAQANAAFGVANSASTYANGAFIQANAAFDTVNTLSSTVSSTYLPKSGGTITGSLNIQHDLTVSGNVTYTGNVTSVSITGNTGSFFGYAANGFNAFYAGLPGGYAAEPNEIAQFTGANNSYVQVNLQNEIGGTDGTSDWVATANNGDNYSYYVDMGIAGNGYDNSSPDNSLGTSLFPNDSYLYAQGDYNTPSNPGGNLVVGAASTGKHVKFISGGVNSANVVLDLSPTAVTLSQPLVFSDATTQTTAASSVAYTQGVFNKANSAYTKANGAVQTGFTTVTANGSSIASSSNTDTLTITSATANGINVLNPSSKTIDIGLRNSGVTAGVYGGSTNIPVITADAFGRITSASNVAVSTTISLGAGSGSGSVSGGGTLTVSGGTGITTSASGSTITVTNAGVTSFNGATGAVTFGSANVTNALGYTPVNVAGDTMTGSLTTSGNVIANSVTSNNSMVIGTTNIVGLSSNSYTTSSTSQVAVDNFSTSVYRTADYQISIKSGTSYHVTEISVLHDGTTVWMDQYSEIFTGSSLGTFDADISAGNLRLLFTPTNSSTTVNLFRRALAV